MMITAVRLVLILVMLFGIAMMIEMIIVMIVIYPFAFVRSKLLD